MLFRTPEIDEQEARVIDQIDQLRSQLRYAVSTPRRWQGVLRRITLARALRGSNTIEGYNVTVEDAIAAQEGEEPLEASKEAWLAVNGYRSAMTYVLQLADDPHFHLTPDLLKSLHFMMLQHDLSKHPGRWRSGVVYVQRAETGDILYEGPDYARAPSLIDELIGQIERDASVPSLVQAAMGHLNLVMIHPFADGNGRMARCLQTLILARRGTLAPAFSSIEEYLGQRTQEYYKVLAEVGGERWEPGRDARSWVRFCLTAHNFQAVRLLRRVRELEKLWAVLEREIQRTGLPERSILALSDAAHRLKVRNATYRTVAEVSNGLAGQDLRALAQADYLRPVGEKRGRYYVATPRLLTIRDATREPRNIADPFSANASTDPDLPGISPPEAES